MNRGIARALAVGLTTAVAITGAAGAASAHQADKWSPFGTAQWVPKAGNGGGHGLVTSSAGGSYGGIELVGAEGPLSELDSVSFDYRADQTGLSGGSPRLVVQLSDGGRLEVRPVAWTADTWAHVDASQPGSVDTNGGGCGYRYGVSLAAAQGCFAGTSVTAAYLVNDSGWLGDETVVVDNITVGDAFAGGPGNSN